MNDPLASLKPPVLAAFYRRLADHADRNRGELTISLAALFMRRWLDNRDARSTFIVEPPPHLRNHRRVLDALSFHRRVYLTQERARLTGGIAKWAGVVPRVIGQSPFQRWDGKGPLMMDYESLVEIPLRYQVTGDDADRDLLHSLHGFQLKTSVIMTGTPPQGRGKWRIAVHSFEAETRDRYDFDYAEHLTLPNPDSGSEAPGAVAPTSAKIIVYHRHAKRVEDAGLAAPYDVRSKRWRITDPRLLGHAERPRP
ncbi:MAG: hypothetical protein ACRET3_10645 [Burkholderiales bacterium]